MNLVDRVIKFKSNPSDFPVAGVIGFFVGIGFISLVAQISSFDSFVNFFSDILIASILAYVAYQNYVTNKTSVRIEEEKHRLELFDRRHNVFESMKALFKAFFKDGTIKQEHLHKFVVESSDAEFLFGDEIIAYRKLIIDKAIRMEIINFRFANERLMGEAARAGLAKEQFELSGWFIDEHESLTDKFRKYLNFPIHQGVK